jgi:hypothetical protein
VAIVELLQPRHDRNAFDCGKPARNAFIQRQARQNAGREIGIYTLAVRAIDDAARCWYPKPRVWLRAAT